MRLKCEDFKPNTHPTYTAAGCYGCSKVHIDIEHVWCDDMHWCISTLVPVMDKRKNYFDCKDIKTNGDGDILLCDICCNLKDNRCDVGNEIKETTVRFD